MLRYTVEGALNLVHTLECLCKPRLNLGAQYDIDGRRSGRKSGSRRW